MKIEYKQSRSFQPKILDALQTDPDLKTSVIEDLKERLITCFEKSLSEVVRLREYLESDVVEISVAVEIGDDNEDDDDDNEALIEEDNEN